MLRSFFTVLLLLATWWTGQIYERYDNPRGAATVQSWNYKKVAPMPLAWNVKYLCEEINRLIEAVFLLLVVYHIGAFSDGRKRHAARALYFYKLVCWSYLTYRVLDIGFWFYSFKTTGYWLVFICLVVFELCCWYAKPLGQLVAKWHHKKNGNGTQDIG